MIPQHDCSRLGCTRLTSEQECDIHAAEPAGVVHPPKEPRPSLTREEFNALIPRRRWCGPYDIAALLAAFDALAAEREEWKRRAEVGNTRDGFDIYMNRADETIGQLRNALSSMFVRADTAEAERDAARAQLGRLQSALAVVTDERDNAAGLLDVVCPSCGPCPGKFTDEDGCCKTCGEQAFFRLVGHPKDPRIEAWRALDANSKRVAIEELRGAAGEFNIEAASWADGNREERVWAEACDIAAAALEALAERP